MSTKKALLIGINYLDKPDIALNGCITDIMQIAGLLMDVYKFKKEDIIILRDDKDELKPTKQRIISELQKLSGSNAANVFFAYSGHGTYMGDTNNDEVDKQDECIVPCDFNSSGVISDDQLNSIFKNCKSSGIFLLDCCHSGTMLDFQFNGINSNKVNNSAHKGIICLAGCQDNQQSAEIFNMKYRIPQGLLTMAFIEALRELNYYPQIDKLWNYISQIIKNSGIEQVPNISSNVEIMKDALFVFESDQTFINSLKSEITAKQTEINTLKAQIVAKQNEVNIKQVENTRLNNINVLLNRQIGTLNSQITTLTTQNRNLNNQVVTLTTQNRNLNTQVVTLNNQVVTLNNQVVTLTKK